MQMIYYEFLNEIDFIFVKINKIISMENSLISEAHDGRTDTNFNEQIERVSVVISNSIWQCV